MDRIDPQITSQLSETIQGVFDLASRVDERVKTIARNHTKLENKIEILHTLRHDLIERIIKLESNDTGELYIELNELRKQIQTMYIEVAAIKTATTKAESRWQATFNIIWQVAVLVAAGYIMFSMGWNSTNP